MNNEEARKIFEKKGYRLDQVCRAMGIERRSLRDNLSRIPLRSKFVLQVNGLPDLIPGESFDIELKYFLEIADMQSIRC